MNVRKNFNRWALLLIVGLLAIPSRFDFPAEAYPAKQAEEGEQAAPAPLSRFITVEGQIDDRMHTRIRNAAEELQNQAVQQDRRAFLFLEIRRGSSQFHHVQGLAKFLTSSQLSRVRTVAWVPERVVGTNAVLALACKEIIMHPDAELGDIGLGQAVDGAEQQLVLSLIDKRHNPKLSRALVQGMMDPQAVTLKVTLGEADDETTESRVLTPEESQRLRDQGVAILDVETIKEAGVAGTFSGSRARALDVLVVQTAETRQEIADRYDLPPEAMREDPASGEELNVRLIRVTDMIDPPLEAFLERQIQRSVAGGANLLIFEIDSPGGFLLSSTNLANKIADLDSEKIRTVAYIPEMAFSGAAIIALGCDQIYMHPRAQIGDAGPIEVGEGGQLERAPEKVLSPLRNTLRDLAEQKNRPTGLAMAMADKNLKVYQVTHRDTGRVWYMTDDEIHRSNDEWVKGRVVPESEEGLLLTVGGTRAHELKLAERPVQDMDELRQRLNIPPQMRLVAVGRTWVDSLVFFLNHPFVTGMLFVAGAVLIYLELHFMTGILGIGSALCFSLFFWSRFLGGTAGWLEVILFLLGLGCLLIEIFVIPGFGVFGVSGGLLLLASLVLASQTFGDINPLQPDSDTRNLAQTMGILSASIVFVVLLAMLLSRYLPRIPLLNQMILTPPGLAEAYETAGPKLRPELAEGSSSVSLLERDRSLVGRQGTALSVLRPAGKGQFGDDYLDVVSDGPYIRAGTPIEIVAVSGNRVVVREVF